MLYCCIVFQENSASASKHGERDIVVQVTPPPERGESSTKLIPSIAKAMADTEGHTNSSLQSINYFDATDLRPFTVFNNKIVGELVNVSVASTIQCCSDRHR